MKDATVEAVGKLSEALERIERARGHLYSMHQLVGGADELMRQAAVMLLQAGHSPLAYELDERLVGRNVLEGRWTFQVVEEFDDGYYAVAREIEQRVRNELMAGRRHVYEAEMKERRRTHGATGHEAAPPTERPV